MAPTFKFIKDFKLNTECIPSVPPGLDNESFYCYLNSSVQVLLHNPGFYWMMRWVSKRVNPKKLRSFKIIKSFKILQDRFYSASLNHTYSAIDAKALKENVTPRFKKGSQEDLDEFLTFVLQGMHDEFLEGRQEYGQLVTPITQLFQGETLSVERNESQPFFSLHLDIISDRVTSVESALRETLLRNGASEIFSKLPPTLIIHFKRFNFNTNSISIEKIFKHIEINSTLNIPHDLVADSIEEMEKTYILSSVCYHDGVSAESGHYFCEVYDESSDQWLCLDDSYVDRCSPHWQLRDTDLCTPYVLLFRRRDTIHHTAHIPL